jgi:hypothetical protein
MFVSHCVLTMKCSFFHRTGNAFDIFSLWFFESTVNGRGAAALRHLKGFDVTSKQRTMLTKARGVMNALLHFVQVRTYVIGPACLIRT